MEQLAFCMGSLMRCFNFLSNIIYCNEVKARGSGLLHGGLSAWKIVLSPGSFAGMVTAFAWLYLRFHPHISADRPTTQLTKDKQSLCQLTNLNCGLPPQVVAHSCFRSCTSFTKSLILTFKFGATFFTSHIFKFEEVSYCTDFWARVWWPFIS